MTETRRKLDRDFRKGAVRLVRRLPCGSGPEHQGWCDRGASAARAPPTRSTSAPSCPWGCSKGGARPPAAANQTRPVPSGHQAGHDRRSRGAFQPKLILW